MLISSRIVVPLAEPKLIDKNLDLFFIKKFNADKWPLAISKICIKSLTQVPSFVPQSLPNISRKFISLLATLHNIGNKFSKLFSVCSPNRLDL